MKKIAATFFSFFVLLSTLFAQSLVTSGKFDGVIGNASVYFPKSDTNRFLVLFAQPNYCDFDFGNEAFSPFEWNEVDHVLVKTDIQDSIHWCAGWKFGDDWQSGQVKSVNTAHDGSIYLSGTWKGRVDFDPGPDSLIVDSDGQQRFFVLKLNESGELLWVKTGSGISSSFQLISALDQDDNLVLCTQLYETLDFSEFGGDVVLNEAFPDNVDLFLQQISPNGEALWSKRLGSLGYDHPKSIDFCNNQFNIISLLVDSIVLNVNGNDQWFVPQSQAYSTIKMEVSPDGQINDAVLFTAENAFELDRTAIDNQGNLFAFARVGGISVTTQTAQQIAIPEDSIAQFVMKINSSNILEWMHYFPAGVDVNHLKVLANGNCWMAGQFSGTVDFDPSSDSVMAVFDPLPVSSHTAFVFALDNNGLYHTHRVLNAETGGAIAFDLQSTGDRVAILGYYYDSLVVTPTGWPVPDNGNAGFLYIVQDDAESTAISPDGEFCLTPNPFCNQFSIYLNDQYDQVEVEVFDLTGNSVFRKQYSNIQKCELQLNCRAAMYIVHVKTPEWEKTARVLKD